MRTLLPLFLTLLSAIPLTAAPAEISSSSAHDFIVARLAADEGDYRRALDLMDRVLEKSPGNPVLLYERAAILLEAGNMSRAESELRKLTREFPDFVDASRLLGRVLLDRSGGSRERIDEALVHLRNAYRLAPEDIATGLTVAQIYMATGRNEEAARVLATLVERIPDNRAANFNYAQLLTRLGRAEEARIYLERVVSADPTYSPAVLQLVDTYQRERQWLNAAEILTPLIVEDPYNEDLRRQQAFFYLRAGRSEEAHDLLQELSEAHPADDRIKFFLAEALSDLGKAEEADEIYRKLLEGSPDDSDFLVSYGLSQLRQRHLDEAETVFRKILALEDISDAVRALARTQIAAIELERGRDDEALSLALESVHGPSGVNNQAVNIALDVYRRRAENAAALAMMDALNTRYPGDLFLQARLLEFALRSDDATRVSQVTSSLQKEGKRGSLAVVDAYVQAKEYGKASDMLKRLLREEPNDISMLFQLGAAYERSGKHDESEKTFERVLALDPEHAPTLNYLGYMWADRAVNLDRAAVMLEKAVSLDPRNGAYIDSLGWVYYRLGQLDKAERYLADAATLLPRDPTIQEHLGDLYMKLGERERALELYRAALRLDPEPTEEATLRSKIRELEKLLE